MNILYALQATGNGHISRAMEIMPYLTKFGQVDVMLSGDNASLAADFPVKYRSKGMSLQYSSNGRLDYLKTARSISLYRYYKEAKELPVDNYDLVINDFESITSLACRLRKKPSLGFGHQVSFHSVKTPRPVKKNRIGEWILKNYAPTSHHVGLHFQRYDDFILPPIVRKEIYEAQPTNKGHITVYLPAFSDEQIISLLKSFAHQFRFEIFSRSIRESETKFDLQFLPVDKAIFSNSMNACQGVLSSAGFETPAEAIFLNKKYLAVPIGGQYEQYCNAAALEKLGVPVVWKTETEGFRQQIEKWLNDTTSQKIVKDRIDFMPTGAIIDKMMKRAIGIMEKRQ